MYGEKLWRYQITEDTDEKATVVLTSNTNEGSVYLAGSKEYNLGQKISLIFTENPDYQFLYWKYDNSIISVTEPKNPSTTAIVKERTDNTATEIRAICAPRLRVESFSPQITETIPSVAKDRAIEIVFNQNLPKDEESLKQLDNIVISIGGTPVNTNFNAPKIVDNKITIEANKSNVLDVSEGQTKTVTVTIPENFYYLFDDVTKVTYGGNGKSFIYVIDETTFDKAGVSYSIPAGAGTFNINTANQPFEYSMGQVIPLEFTPNEEWDFYGWKITDSEGKDVDTKYLEIKKEKNGEYYLYVKESIQGVNIKADCAKRLEILSLKVGEQNLWNNDGYVCNTQINITFNKPVDKDSVQFSDNNSKRQISITKAGNSVEHYENYFDMKWTNNNTELTLIPKVLLENGEVKILKDLVPNPSDKFDFLIKFNEGITDTEGVGLNLAESEYSYRINGTNVNTSINATMKLYKPVYNFDEETGEYTELSNIAFENWDSYNDGNSNTKDDNIQLYKLNHVGNKIYFDYEIKDLEAGIKSVSIKETLIRLANTTEVNYPYEQKDYVVNYVLSGDYKQEEKVTYTLQSEYDGIVKLDFVFKDFYNTEIEFIYYVIKDTVVDRNVLQSFNSCIKTLENISQNEQINTKNYTQYGSNISGLELLKENMSQNDKVISKLTLAGKSGEARFLDIFYNNTNQNQIISGKYGTAINYKVYYGYKINDITREVEITYKENQKIFFFEIKRDIQKNCYLKIIGYDDVGNFNSIVSILPKKIDINCYSKTDNKINLIIPEIAEFNRYVKENISGDVKYYIIYSINSKNNAEIFYKYSEFDVDAINNIDLDSLVTLKDGEYYNFYILPIFSYGKDFRGEDVIYPGVVSNPVTYGTNNTNTTQPNFPDSFEVEYENIQKGSGGKYLKIKYPQGFIKTEGYNYAVKVIYLNLNDTSYGKSSGKYFKNPEEENLEYIYYPDDKVFIKSQYTNFLILCAFNNANGNFFTKKILMPGTTTNEVYNILGIEDLNSPIIEAFEKYNEIEKNIFISFPNEIVLRKDVYFNNGQQGPFSLLPTDTVEGYYPISGTEVPKLYTNENGNYEIKYYIFEKSSPNFTEEEISEEKLETAQSYIMEYDKSNKYKESICLDIRNLDESFYNVVFDIKDNYENKKRYNAVISNSVYHIATKMYTNEKGKLSFNINERSYQYYFDCFYLEKDQNEQYWKHGKQYPNSSENFVGNTKIKDYITGTFDNKFIRGVLVDYSENYKHYLYSYIYPEYYIKKNNGETVNVNNKTMLQAAGNTFQVFYDAPCFVHTMCHPKDLSKIYPAELAEEDRAAYWETKGKEVGLELITNGWTNGTKTYTVPLNEIDPGEYYVTVAHFADGSYVMSDVKQR